MNHLLLGTRKGLVVYQLKNKKWTYQTVHFMGIAVSLVYVDERTNTWWACLDHGHWGIKLHRSTNHGQDWTELAAPKYPEGMEVKDGVPASTRYLWAMSHGGSDQDGKLWIGTEPGGLFVSHNNGDQFELVESLWNEPSRKEKWFGGGRDHAGIHSVVVDPNNSAHLYVGISCAGVYESIDGGANWAVRNKGLRADYLPDPFTDVGHDPHLLVACAKKPEVMWQQNHCGIFKSDDAAMNWQDVSSKDGPANFGFAIAVDNNNPDRAWVAPCISDEIRVAVNNTLCISRTDDGGQTWTDFRNGLPQEACFDIVYRHCLQTNENWAVFGTTCGNLFMSDDHGESWNALNHFLPMIYSITFAQ